MTPVLNSVISDVARDVAEKHLDAVLTALLAHPGILWAVLALTVIYWFYELVRKYLEGRPLEQISRELVTLHGDLQGINNAYLQTSQALNNILARLPANLDADYRDIKWALHEIHTEVSRRAPGAQR
jgi:hypothetical protein